ncbi:MAG: hypothetical protein AB8G77_01780 [Rhodothermales bacterium]
MKKSSSVSECALLFLFVFVVMLFATVNPVHGQDFREMTWGMTVDEVKEIEGMKVLDENENMFVYAVKIADREAILFYKHDNNKVVEGGYSFQQHYDDKNDYVNEYEALKKELTAEFGGPTIDEMLWKNDLYREDQDSLGLAVGMGYLIYWADWEAGDTIIELALHGNNNLHVLAMNYASATYEKSLLRRIENR